jgi:lysophospholipid acyltransferase (LPLAT)-like uncharacterized protein
MKIRHPIILRWAGFVIAVIARLWHMTVRPVKMSLDGRRHPIDPRRERFIYAVWHDSILSLMYLRAQIDVLISHHTDGELITQACRFLDVGVIRGSSTRGGTAALMKMVEQAQNRHLLVTPDGPRGPRHVIRPGLVYLASITGLPIILLAVGYSRAWRLKTWDRTAVPCPGCATYGVISEPIEVPAGLSHDEVAEYCGRIERRFIEMTAAAQQWADSGRRPDPAELLPPVEAPALPKCA